MTCVGLPAPVAVGPDENQNIEPDWWLLINMTSLFTFQYLTFVQSMPFVGSNTQNTNHFSLPCSLSLSLLSPPRHHRHAGRLLDRCAPHTSTHAPPAARAAASLHRATTMSPCREPGHPQRVLPTWCASLATGLNISLSVIQHSFTTV